jgi:hypothetical protein
MAERDVRDKHGNGFRLKSFEYRSEPWTSPLTGRSIRCVVGKDENGAFRLARRTGRMGAERFEMSFAREAYATKEAALRDSRAMKVDFIRGEAETWLEKNRPNNQEIFRVDCIEGWRHSTAPREPDSAKEGAMEILDRMEGGKGKEKSPERERTSRFRERSLER